MELATQLRTLWRHRVWLAAGTVLAILAGLMIAFQLPSLKSRTYKIGVASATILVDTPKSQVVDVNPLGINSVAATANLLAVVMTQGTVKDSIAEHAGLRPAKLATISASAAGPQNSVSDSVVRDPHAGILTTNTLINAGGDQLPVISIQATATNAVVAARLADSASTGLLTYLQSTAAAERIPDHVRLRVTSLGAAQAHEETRGPSWIVSLGVAILVYALFCAAILAASALARGFRQLDEMDELADLEDGDFTVQEELPIASVRLPLGNPPGGSGEKLAERPPRLQALPRRPSLPHGTPARVGSSARNGSSGA